MIGAAVLIGWAFDLPALRSLIPGAVQMKANTAVGLILVSIALWITASRDPDDASPSTTPVDLLASVVALLGLVTLCQYMFGWNAGIDELLFRDTGAAFNAAKGRMSPYSAVAFIALGLAAAGLAHRRLLAAVRGATGLVTAIGLVSIIGYLWNAREIVTDRWAPPVAINTACAFVLLGSAMFLMANPGRLGARRRARSRLERLVLGGFVPTVLFVLVGGGLTYQSGVEFARTSERIAHTQEVRAELGLLYGAVTDAEMASRSEVLSGAPAFRSEMRSRAAEARRRLEILRNMIGDNPDQLRRHGQLSNLVEARIEALEAAGRALDVGGEASVRSSLALDLRDRLTMQIREVSRTMDEAEVALLRARLATADTQRQNTLVSLLGTLVLLSLLFLLLFRSIQREMLARIDIEEDLQRVNAGLEQRVAERTQELSFQQGFLRRVIDLNRSFIFAKDREGRFVLANQALADARGTTVEQLVGHTELQFGADPEQLKQFATADLQVIESGRELVIDEEMYTNASGEDRWLFTVKRPILSPDGISTIVLGVSADITDRKKAQNEVLELNADLERRVHERTVDLEETNAKLELASIESASASRAKSAFLANMSHEIRTPMNAIIGLTHLMSRETRDSLQRERLGKIGDAAQHLLQVINDILDLSKIEAGKLMLDDAEFALEDMLTRVMELVSGRARDKGLELIVDPEDLPARLRGDPMRLSQILINLLSNAVKFTEKGWVRLRGEMVREENARVLVRFEVRDTGPGIALERQSLLFKAFEQADNSSSRQHGGTGLGLALARQLATAMGGEAGVVSAPGDGSVFWFTAWLGRGSAASAVPVSISMEGLRALVVDDLPEARHVIGQRLILMGLAVDAVDSGPAALQKTQTEMAAGRPYDVMIIDWRMEPLDGLETLSRLRDLLGDGTPPSILVTAFDDPSLVQKARKVRFDSVLLKPITTSALHDTLIGLLRQQNTTSQLVANPASDSEALLRARHGGQRVLLAEDNPINREVAEELLRAAGLVVEAAWDGARAVEMALSRQYDLILMDVQMPVMDGLEAARIIRDRSGRGTPIIAMTANAFTEDRQACLDAGMNDHVAKPVDPEMMYSTMLRWLPLRAGRGIDRVARTPLSFGRSHATEGSSAFQPLGADTEPDAYVAAPQQALNVEERLARIEGFDVSVALANLGGQRDAMVRVLGRFVRAYRQGAPGLLDASGGEGEGGGEWRVICHSLRGALATIGAKDLAERAVALEAGLTAENDAASRAGLADQARQLHEGLIAHSSRIESELAG